MRADQDKDGFWSVVDEDGYRVTRQRFGTKDEALSWMDWADAAEDGDVGDEP